MTENDENAARSFALIIQTIALFVVAVSDAAIVIIPCVIIVMVCTLLMIGIGKDEKGVVNYYKGVWNK